MKTLIVVCLMMVNLSVNTRLWAATYYVSPTGDDKAVGTSEKQPFRVVQHAIEQMAAGDTLIVLDGLYSGTLKLKSGITIRAKNQRKVIFTGAEPLKARFSLHNGTIYKAKISGTPKRLFYNGKPMTWARWPNCEWAENWVEEKKWAPASKGTGPGRLKSEAFKDIAEMDLAGGYCFIRYGKGNSCYSRRIESYDGKTLRWNDDNFYEQRFTGEDGWRGSPGKEVNADNPYHPMNSRFYLGGKLKLLDVPGEWFAEGNTLYLYPLDTEDPNRSRILVQTQSRIIDHQEAIEDITIEGIDFVATSLNFSDEGNKGITLRNNHFSYIGSELLFIDRKKGNHSQSPITVNGSGITVEKCLFSGAELSALSMKGKDIVIVNNVFLENNRNAVFEARPVSLRPDGHYKVSRNTFINSCSDAIYIRWEHIEIPEKQPEVSYNHVCNSGIFNSDVSGVYMPSRSQGYLAVHHNWFHQVNGNAIRLDISGKHLIVHHNVIWNSKRGLNFEGHGDFMVYNNTSVLNLEAGKLTLNQARYSERVPKDWVAGDYSFPLIGEAPNDNWHIYNNLVSDLYDWVKGKEYRQNRNDKHDRPERKSQYFSIKNRGSVQGNMFRFKEADVFRNIAPGTIDLRPTKRVEATIREGAAQPAKTKAPKEYLPCMGRYRGAYEPGGDYWYPGSDWLPYGLIVPKTMAQADALARKLCNVSIVPETGSEKLRAGRLNSTKEDLLGTDP